MSIDLLVPVLVLVVTGAVLTWRWRVVNRPALALEACESLSAQVVSDLFQYAKGVGALVPVKRSYWTDLPGHPSDAQWIYLCRWMIGRGMVTAPEEWSRLAILLGNPPTGLALTQRTWELSMEARRTPSISIGDGNGPINIGGTQFNLAGQGITAEQLHMLVEAVRADALILTEPEASSAQAAADTLERAASGRVDANSPDVTGAVSWIRKRAGEAVGSAAGSALWASTLAALRALGIL